MCGLKHQKEKRSMDYFAGLDVSVKETSVCIVDDAGKIVREARVASEPAGFDEHHLSLQASWAGSWTAVAVALQRSRRCGLASDLCRDTTHAGRAEGTDQQDGPQRCARHSTDDAGRALSTGACEDVAQPEASNAHDPSQATSVEGHRH